MSKYYDEDDLDYDDDVPVFQDENEFDDYLNDEEFDLMNQLFPLAKEELKDYQGWDNLAVKVAIFDNNFEIEPALIALKRQFKKKVEPKPVKKLSALELLARKRAESKHSSSLAPDKSLSLLESLRNNHSRGTVGIPTEKPVAHVSLTNKLQSLSSKYRDTSAESKKTSTHTLASKLASLRKSTPVVVSTNNHESGPTADKVESAAKNSSSNPAPDSWTVLVRMKASISDMGGDEIATTSKVPLTNVLVNRNEQRINGKRKHDELFSVFYPNTNNNVVKKQAVANFKQPSPDDVVLKQQKAAFEVNAVKEKVSSLSIEDTQKSKELDVEKEDADDDESLPFEEPTVKTYKKSTIPTKPKNPVNIEEHLKNRKPHLNFVVLGHVDAGKSTLMGRLLYDVGAVDSKLIRKLKKESEMIGKSSFHLAWVMDQTTEERERGVTVDICTSDFETSNSTFTIVDAPGHRDFVPNAIIGISQADVAVLSIDCGTDAFESGFNLDGQTKEHTLLARSLGMKHIIVAMNKMDSVSWYEGRFKEIQSELSVFFKEIGFAKENISWVPCSGLSGEGICKTGVPSAASWYKGSTLVKELETVASKCALQRNDLIKESFIFSILEVTPSSKALTTTVSGKVEAGSIQPGESITIYPSEQSCVVESILCGNESQKTSIAIHGDFVQLKLKNAFAEDIQCGDFASIVGTDIASSQEFTARLLTFNLERPLLPGTSLMLFRGAAEQPCRILKLCYTVDKNDPTKVLKKKVKHIGSHQSAVVKIELIEKKRRIPMMTFEQNNQLGRVILRKEGRTVAAALIKSLDY